MSPELIASIFTGLTGLVVGLGAYTANRSRSIAADHRELRRQVRKLQKQLVATLGHVFELEIRMASSGLPVPERPKILEDLDDDDATAAATAKRSIAGDGGGRDG
jgi:hypothetical protein